MIRILIKIYDTNNTSLYIEHCKIKKDNMFKHCRNQLLELF